jgi:ATP-binding cassette subfamily B multidrug efflux pump
MQRLSDYVKRNKYIIIFGMIIKIIGTASELAIPWILAYMVDTAATSGDIRAIYICGVIMLACAAMAFFGNVNANRLAAKSSKNITQALRSDLFRKICYLSCSRMDAITTPSAISRLTSNTYDVNKMLNNIQRMGVRAPILLIGGIIITLTLDAMLTLVLVCTLPLIIITVYLISKKGIIRYTATYKAADDMVRTVRENITGIRVIKALSKTEYEKERFARVNEGLSAKEKSASRLMAASSPLMNLFLNLGLVGVIIAGATRVNLGLTQPGKIIAFMTYFTLMLNAMIAITRIFVMYSKSLASSKRIFEVINSPVDLIKYPEDRIETDYHILFDNVSFSYLKVGNNLSDISFRVKRGETLGIIGGVGSGKTTIINLLMRFYDVDNGAVRINGTNVKCIPFEKLYKMFGTVFQNDILFSDTVYNNIDFYRGDPKERVIEAAVSAQASSFIENIEEGYEHKLAIKGADLSGGQKQRMLLARALSKDAEILVFDDSSSALDYKTDAALRKAVGAKYPNSTKIIVAQRVSSIKHADIIIVLEEGRIVGKGKHAHLMQNCPYYKEIYDIQMGQEKG